MRLTDNITCEGIETAVKNIGDFVEKNYRAIMFTGAGIAGAALAKDAKADIFNPDSLTGIVNTKLGYNACACKPGSGNFVPDTSNQSGLYELINLVLINNAEQDSAHKILSPQFIAALPCDSADSAKLKDVASQNSINLYFIDTLNTASWKNKNSEVYNIDMAASGIEHYNYTSIGVGEDKPIANKGIRAYPNPATTRMNIEFANKGAYQILDITGREVGVLYADGKTENGAYNATWNCEDVANGNYFIRALDVVELARENGKLVTKITPAKVTVMGGK